jgi:microsomal dipeptidase-like Zn-dependent dipeptidase
MSPREITAVLRSANKMGLRRLVVNHPNFVIEANPAQAREWVDLGAVVEHGLVQHDDRTTFFQWQIDTMLSFIDAVGIDNTIIGSDLGQKNNPFRINSYERVLGQLLDAGISPQDVRKLVAVNTGRVLDG